MSSFRPVTDVWILARSKSKYYGSFPHGFLSRARALLGVGLEDSVLHVCAGKVREYTGRGFGAFDQTLDLDPACRPSYLRDARGPLPKMPCALCWNIGWEVALRCAHDGEDRKDWDAALIDRPYTPEDAAKYRPGAKVFPELNALLKQAIAVVKVGGKVGALDYVWPQPPRNATEVAVVAVGTGRNNRARWFCVFERLS